MIFFIIFLRALAACLITNCHYVGIYPTDVLANGGLLGDVIFFAVSGYCLLNVKKSFPSWYGKRLWRIYPSVIIILVVYLLLGQYSYAEKGLFQYFVYPTYYHFVGSIIFLYIPFYFVGRYEVLKKNIPLIATIVAGAYFIVYFCFYDKSYYHVDVVGEWMIRFLFFESMLLGGYFRYNDEKIRNKFNWGIVVGVTACTFAYYVFKLLLRKVSALIYFQWVSQLLILSALFFIFWLFMSLDKTLEKLPKFIKWCITFVSEITLEIYVVQFPIIFVLRQYMGFPLNWLVITASIVLAATILHYVSKLFTNGVEFVVVKIKDYFSKRKKEKI